MLNNIRLPEGGLEVRESRIEGHTAIAYEKAVVQAASLSALVREYQHRNFEVGSKGNVSRVIKHVCTGQNQPGRVSLGEHGSIFVFVFPGEDHEIHADWYHCTYRYNDDPNSNARRWLRFLLSDKSPWKYVHRNIVTLDPDRVYTERCIIFQHCDVLPHRILQSFLMACRWQVEHPDKFRNWIKLVDAGCDEAAAFMVAVNFRHQSDRPDTLYYRCPLEGHEAMVYPQHVIRNMLEGRYRGNSEIFGGSGTLKGPGGSMGPYHTGGFSCLNTGGYVTHQETNDPVVNKWWHSLFEKKKKNTWGDLTPNYFKFENLAGMCHTLAGTKPKPTSVFVQAVMSMPAKPTRTKKTKVTLAVDEGVMDEEADLPFWENAARFFNGE